MQTDGLFEFFFFLISALFKLILVGTFFDDQAADGSSSQTTTVFQVAKGNLLALRVRFQPTFATPQELLDLVLPNPVMFVVIQHRNKHIEMGQQVAQTAGGLEC